MKPNQRQKDNLSVENILKLSELYDDNVPRSMEKESKSIPGSSIESRIESLRRVSDTKVPKKKSIKIAKSKEDIEDEFEVIEIPMMMKEFEEYLKLNPGRSFRDFLEDNKKESKKMKKKYDEIVLSGALAKIDNVMSGIMSMAKGGIIKDPTYTYYSEGGSSKKPPIKDPIPVKKIDIMDYHKLGMALADLSEYERDLIKDLLEKTLPK
jgi:hypothetical protein